MRKPRTSVLASVATSVALLLGATSTARTSATSSKFASTSERFGVTYRTPDRDGGINVSNAVWVTTAATPALMVNASSDCVLLGHLQEGDVDSLSGIAKSIDFQTSVVDKAATNPCAPTSTTATTTNKTRSNRTKRPTNTTPTTSATSSHTADATRYGEHMTHLACDAPAGVGPVLVHWWGTPVHQVQLPGDKVPMTRLIRPSMPLVTRPKSSTSMYHDRFGGGAHEDSSYQSRWREFRHEPLCLPDQFMARFINILMYLAEVITADVISAILFGRVRPRYYQRARRNRCSRIRRRRFRRWSMYSSDILIVLRDTCVQLWDTLVLIDNDASGPTVAQPAAAAAAAAQLASIVASPEYSALILESSSTATPMSQTISTVASLNSRVVEIPTSRIISAVASPEYPGAPLVSTCPASLTSDFPELRLVESCGVHTEANTTDKRPSVSPVAPLLLVASEASAGPSRLPSASFPESRVEIALSPAVSQLLSLLSVASQLKTETSLAQTQGVPEPGIEKETLIAASPGATVFSPAPALTNGCALTSDKETEYLAVPGVNLLLEGSASPCRPTNPATRKHRPSLVAAETNSGNAESMVNTLGRYNTAERRVNTVVEEFGGQDDTAGEPPPAPFFVSEHYTPESTCYVSAHGVAYTTIIVSYGHRFNLPTKRKTQDDTPTITRTADMSDVLFPAVNARMRCKWSRGCIQTTSSEYYRSTVEAVFVSRFIPDETDMVVLNDLVRRYL